MIRRALAQIITTGRPARALEPTSPTCNWLAKRSPEGLDNPRPVENFLQVNGAGEFAVCRPPARRYFCASSGALGVNGAALRPERNTVGRHGAASLFTGVVSAPPTVRQRRRSPSVKTPFTTCCSSQNRHQPQPGTVAPAWHPSRWWRASPAVLRSPRASGAHYWCQTRPVRQPDANGRNLSLNRAPA